MSDDIFQGYKGAGLEVLKKFNVRVWGQAEVLTSRGDFKGTVLPRVISTYNLRESEIIHIK